MKTFLLLCGFFCISLFTTAQVYINELMPSNINGIMDDRYDFPDSWVELYNAGNSSIDLQGWYLSNDKDNLMLWKIPVSCPIPAKGYQLIYLDKEDTQLHANFRLDIKGDKLYLVKPDGTTIVDKLSSKFDKQEPNISFGRIGDGGKKWGWFLTSTPKASNNNVQSVDKDRLVPMVAFSHKSGICAKPITLKLSPFKDTKTFKDHIYYTTDGTVPTLHSKHYEGPITIDTTTVIRAQIIREGYLPQLTTTKTYLYPQRNITLPVVSLTTDPDYLWDDMIGIYTDGKNGKYFVGNAQKGFFNWAQDWRRPVNIEYFIEGTRPINQIGEMRIMGGWAREKAQKPLAVYANKRFGTKRFNYPFFQEKTPLDDGYKSIILRNSGQDFNHTFMRDAVNHYLVAGKVDIDYQAYQPAIVYLNGQYWGIHNIRERSNEDHILANYNTENIDMLENFQLKNGDKENWEQFNQLISNNNFTYQDLDRFLDLEETMNYLIVETFVENRDWPTNNVVCWRNRDNGKWRWIFKDTDYCTSVKPNMFEHIYSKTTPLPRTVKACFSNELFKDKFIDRYTVYLGDIFQKEVTTALIDSFANQIKEEMEYSRPRWNLAVKTWKDKVNSLKKEIQRRPNAAYNDLQSFFNLGKPIPVTISTTTDSHTPKQGLIINDLPLHEKQFDGKFFNGRPMAITLTDTEQNEDFRYWSVTKIGLDSITIQERYTERTLLLDVDTTLMQVAIKAFIGEEEETVGNQIIHAPEQMMITSVKGGVQIHAQPNTSITIYSIEGKLLKQFSLLNNHYFLPLPTGIYIINRQKVIVN